MTLARRITAEAVGTAALAAVVIGSGIMAERLAGGSAAIALLANSLATGAALVALLLVFGPMSGAHLNPVVSLVEAAAGRLRAADAAGYVAAQTAGAVVGAAVAHAMFELPLWSMSLHARTGSGQWLGEFVATAGLVAVIRGCARSRPDATPLAVACYVVAAYWFTSSTSFANPALAVARALSDTFAGIRPVDVPAFVAAQLAGGAMGAALFAWLLEERREQDALPRAERVERVVA